MAWIAIMLAMVVVTLPPLFGMTDRPMALDILIIFGVSIGFAIYFAHMDKQLKGIFSELPIDPNIC